MTIAVLGSANMDLVVRQARAVRPGETMFGESFSTGPGGKGLNQAVAAVRAGAEVRFLGAVGSDTFGDELRGFLERERVDIARLATDAEATGIAAITVTDDGENSIVVVPGANAATELTDADRDAIASSSHLVLQGERPPALLAEAMRFAREHGVTTVLTPAPVADALQPLIELADVLVPNEGEACELAGVADVTDAATALSLRAGSPHAGTVIVTRGAEGCLIARGGEIVAEVAARRARAVDTTGAGDTFVGVLVAWLAAGAEVRAAVDAATIAAAISVTRPGAAASMPTRAEIDAALSASL